MHSNAGRPTVPGEGGGLSSIVTTCHLSRQLSLEEVFVIP